MADLQQNPRRALPLRLEPTSRRIQQPEEKEGDRFSLTLTMPGVPRGKGAGKVGIIAGHGSIFTDTKTRNEMAVIRHMAAEAMAGRPPYDGAVILRMCAYRPLTASMSNKRKAAALAGKIFPTTKPDYSNYAKMEDALNKIVWVDDALVVSAVIHKRFSENPRLVIDVRSFVG